MVETPVDEKTCAAIHKGLDAALASLDGRMSSLEGYGKKILAALAIGIVLQFSGIKLPAPSVAAAQISAPR